MLIEEARNYTHILDSLLFCWLWRPFRSFHTLHPILASQPASALCCMQSAIVNTCSYTVYVRDTITSWFRSNSLRFQIECFSSFFLSVALCSFQPILCVFFSLCLPLFLRFLVNFWSLTSSTRATHKTFTSEPQRTYSTQQTLVESIASIWFRIVFLLLGFFFLNSSLLFRSSHTKIGCVRSSFTGNGQIR